MPYNKESKRLAKEHVQLLRQNTLCIYCGRQPIEYHNEEHEQDSNRRVAHLVALGFPIPVIDAEIAKCEAVCRSCHMKKDGRLKQLLKNAPLQKGTEIVGLRPCEKCGKDSKPTWNGMCRRCYDYQRRH